jgi:5-formaminoimidazole-4-carboxamide-1-beta-D-ribofuranosyl 5'-monophosphate synthetase
MEVTPNEITYKKKIGSANGGDVLEVATKGGWHMVVVNKGKSFETLGVGPHRGVARFIAQKKDPTMIIHELEKSEPLFIPTNMVQKYTAITNRFNELIIKFGS